MSPRSQILKEGSHSPPNPVSTPDRPHTLRDVGPVSGGHPKRLHGLKTPCKDGSERNQQYLALGNRPLSSHDAFQLPRNVPEEQKELGCGCGHDREGYEPAQGRAFCEKEPTRVRPEVRRALTNRLEGQPLLQRVLVKINRLF